MRVIDGEKTGEASPLIATSRITVEDAERPPREVFLLGQMIPLGKSSVLFGPSSVGKSAAAAQIVFSLASGAAALWGLPILPGGGPVLVYTAEDSLDDWKRKAAAIREDGRIDVARALERLHLIDRSEGVARLSEVVTERSGSVVTFSRRRMEPTEERLGLIATAKRIGAVAILVETASRLVEDEDNANMSALQSALGNIGRETGAAVLTSHHPTKAASKDNDPTPEAARGGGAFTMNARNVVSLFPAEPEVAGVLSDRFPADDVLTLRHGKPTSSTRRQGDVTLIRCPTSWGAVLHRPEDVAHTPEQAARNAARLDAARDREREQLGRLYDLAAELLKLGPVSPNRLEGRFRDLGVPKHKVAGLVQMAIRRGAFTIAERNKRGIILGLGRDPRLAIDGSTPTEDP